MAALINHSCLPNDCALDFFKAFCLEVQEHFLGDLLILRAAKAIAAEEDIVASFLVNAQELLMSPRAQRAADEIYFEDL